MIIFTNLALAVAVALVESAGTPTAVNKKHGAYGPLQIRQAALDDINAYAGTHYTLRQFVGNMPLSTWAFQLYGEINNAHTPEQFVSIWHYGATGAKREHPGDDYVERVMRLYNEANKKDGV
jgi:hypothetical protein